MKKPSRSTLTTALFATLLAALGVSPSHAAVDAAPEVTDAPPPHVLLTQFLLQEVENPRQLAGYRIAILATDAVDGFDLEVPRRFLTERGATVDVIVPRPPALVRATGSGAIIQQRTHLTVLNPSGEADEASIDRFLDQVVAESYDAVYVPGHRGSVDRLADEDSVAFLRATARSGRAIFSANNAVLVIARAGLLDSLVQARGFAGAEGTLRGSAYPTASDAPGTIAGIHVSRNAFEMPQLMNRLVDTLTAKPAISDR